jgi:1,4-alpha-glucan branching enzyme
MYLPLVESTEPEAPSAASAGRGAFTFMLHSHLPYVRESGTWPHGEEWLYEALAETYLPLLDTLSELADAGIRGGVTIGLTPILCEQLADPLVIERFAAYTSDRAERAAGDVERLGSGGEAGARARAAVAAWYADWYGGLHERFTNRYRRDVLGAFRGLQDDGVIEIATSAATHGYLPLLISDSSIRGQLREGIRSYERFFGRRPRSIWLPECAYRPAVPEGSPMDAERSHEAGARLRPGLENWLQAEGLEVFFCETQMLEGGPATTATRGELIGPYGAVRRRRGAPKPTDEPARPATTYEAYFVRDSEVAVIGRNERTSLQVWSGTVGYPGDYVYREFHRRDDVSGMQYWRITGRTVDLGDKEPWDPTRAFERTREHAGHFAWLVHELLAEKRAEGLASPLIVAAYDTELFGHWWFEGIDWLGHVLRYTATDPEVELVTAGGRIEAVAPTHAVELPEGSWGLGGTHFTWWNDQTAWFWPQIHAAEARIERLVGRELGEGTPERERLAHLAQACRELLLLQASDWPFLVTTGQAGEYASERFREHIRRFEALCEDLESSEPTETLAGEQIARRRDWAIQDNPFPTLEPRSFGPPELAGPGWAERAAAGG